MDFLSKNLDKARERVYNKIKHRCDGTEPIVKNQCVKGEYVMKMRRTAIVAFVLCACLIIGFGYAAMTHEMTLNGTLHAGARSSLEVWFVGAEIPTKNEDDSTNMCTVATLSAATGVTKSLTANMETDSLKNVGDKATAKFKIKNEELAANQTHAEIVTPEFSLAGANGAFTNPEAFYEVSYKFVEDTDGNAALDDDDHSVTIAADAQSVTDLPPQHAVYLVVTVTLKASVTDESVSHAANFTLTFTANAVTATHTGSGT